MFKILRNFVNLIMTAIFYLIIITTILFIIFTVVKVYSNNKSSNEIVTSKNTDEVYGKIINMEANSKKTNKDSHSFNVDIKILSGKFKGKTITVPNLVVGFISNSQSNNQEYAKLGDEVLVNLNQDADGNIKDAYIYEIVRYKYLYKLSLFFLILLILFGGIKGFKSIITLLITGFAVIKILIPLILNGYNAILTTAIICILLVIINLIIINGCNKKTLSAIIGTSGGVLIAGAIAFFLNSVIRVNGFTDEEIQSMINITQNQNINLTGIYFAGLIMGALGAVMDVSMSIASAVYEIKAIRPKISVIELIKSGMNVGKDIMGTMTNTLILAYVGGSMYIIIMILPYINTLSTVINQDIIAAEILKTLAGSIGLIIAIPLTVIVSTFLSLD
ncbi:YibE/F family protein [Aceticella autotrophica]|uniref:YibE/F family protein n=1 Tax=Aceticella autotrophica TaxID=2755338 RepID=A0A975GAH4_9THEO|nr:YibE/F family protein [Aceticella autotrophica]QSZ27102.1 YibE/F family protein [Aceticella autotrophica]